ncbi:MULTISPECIES: phage tail assembly protein [unclassified Halomonas]|uniref:phage tail assembly protein n=1 Tax=unclassified Halomonas TaxID=2609666 RepID=UPI001CF4EE38|nr:MULTISPECIES: phage tail assembly protein [unclassified Halomonas]MCA8865597.1 phage tail assembly protein [Halomonas sp. SBBP1]UZH10455.1 phage tail assembly protein [Halomonas sp. BDJS001]
MIDKTENQSTDTQAVEKHEEQTTAAAPGVPTEVVPLETPLQRGKTTVKEITVRKPMSGGMRGVSLVDIMNFEVTALHKVLPRITTPPLTEAEVKTLDIVDLIQLGTALNGFLIPKKFKETEA